MIDYKTVLHEDITELQAATKRGEFPREFRIEKINQLTEDYFRLAGEMPDEVALERLTDLILYEELTDPNIHKVLQTEYPFLSERQFERRDNREIVAGENIENNATDGRDYTKQVRRKRSGYENRLVDKKARSENMERRLKYNAFIAGKTPGVFTVNIKDGVVLDEREN